MIHDSHINLSISFLKCLICGARGYWRTGRVYDHEKICHAHEHSVIWCPKAIYDYLLVMAKNKVGLDGDSI